MFTPGVQIWQSIAPEAKTTKRPSTERPGVEPYVSDAAQDMAVAADRHGDFWVTWVRYNPNTGIPQVLLSRLDSDTARLTAPQQPFTDEARRTTSTGVGTARETGSLMRQGVTTDCGTPMTASASSARWSRKGSRRRPR